jgi:hypothetical protein
MTFAPTAGEQVEAIVVLSAVRHYPRGLHDHAA